MHRKPARSDSVNGFIMVASPLKMGIVLGVMIGAVMFLGGQTLLETAYGTSSSPRAVAVAGRTGRSYAVALRGDIAIVPVSSLGDHRVCRKVGRNGAVQCYADFVFAGVSKVICIVVVIRLHTRPY